MIFDIPRNDPLQQSAISYRLMVRLDRDGGTCRGPMVGARP